MTGRGGMPFARLEAWVDYLRAMLWRLRGARMGVKCRIGAQCRATLAGGITLGNRVALEQGVMLKLVDASAEVRLQDHVFVGRGCTFDIAGSLLVGEGALIAPGCFITDHNHGLDPDMPIWKQPCRTSPVSIGADVWLGARVVVLPGVTIGDGAVVAAGAVVSRDVAPMSIVAGVPARFMRYRAHTDAAS